MSWLNNSLNTIKGQLTTLAQEVLAETAGPGDEDYRGGDGGSGSNVDNRTALELLADTQKEKEQLDKLCCEKESEIANLRKQITELQKSKISDSGGGNSKTAAATTSGRTSKSPIDNNAILEDSWCWEPDNVRHDNDHSSETSSGNGTNEMVNITLEEVPLGATAKTAKRSGQSNAPLQKHIHQLEAENKQLNLALEELDSQHNVAMQNVLELKMNLQEKLSLVTKDYEALKKEHAEKFINGELELGRVKKKLELLEREHSTAEVEKKALQKKIDDYAEELKRAAEEMADLQVLLEKQNHDNVELIARVKAASKDTEKAEVERSELMQKVDQLMKEMEEVQKAKEKKTSESSSSSLGKQSEDEFIVVRDGDASSSGPTTPPTKEELKDKIVQLENRVSELTLENGSLSLKLEDREMEKELASNVLKENLQELQSKCDDQEENLKLAQEQLAEQQEKVDDLKDRAADAIIAQEQLKVLSEAKVNMELEITKMKEARNAMSELEKRLIFSEQEKESLQLEVQGLRTAQERVSELESKLQKLTLENQQLTLNAEAETETLNNSAELEDKLKRLAEENETYRAELESISQAKLHQAFEDEKQEITDLDADEEEPFNLDKLRELLNAYLKQDVSGASSEDATTKAYRALRERLWKIDSLEKNLAQMSEEILDLQDNKLVWDHEKKTLEADISQYILQCDELMKNNEILLNELENYKRNKLETIPEHNEENVLLLESQLEEYSKLNRTLEEEYSELNEKIEELEREKQKLSEQLRSTQQSNESLIAKAKNSSLEMETLELEKCNMMFELNELKSSDTKDSRNANEALKEAQENCQSLESQLARLSKDHADLVAAMQAQKTSLMEAVKKREETEQALGTQETLVEEMRKETHLLQLKSQEETDTKLQLRNNEEQNMQLKQELLAKDIVAENYRSEIKTLQDRLAGILAQTKETLERNLLEDQQLLANLQQELEEKSRKEESQQSEINRLLQTQKNMPTFEEFEKLKLIHEMLEQEYGKLQELFESQSTELQALKDSAAANITSSNITTDTDSLARIAQLEADLLATADLQKTVDALNFEKNEMIKALQQKHSENMQYYMEIQRLQPIVQQLQQQLQAASDTVKACEKCPSLETTIGELRKEHEKFQDQINFLKEKSDILTTNLLTEQTNQKLIQQEKAEVEEQNAAIRKDLERLREHLLEVEDMHTQETVDMSRELGETKAKMIALQEDVSKSSNAYTSASIRANQHAETLQAQYALVVQQRDELVAKLSLAEDRESKNQAALCNLQCALEQFQNDKENDIKAATQRIRKELQHELDKEANLHNEITLLNQQLTDANQGLRAASRLSDQLEACQQTIAALREEADTLKQQNGTLEGQLNTSESSQTDKIDKNLIKSLLIGYVVSGNPNDKNQVLRMISSVLNFTSGESDKVGLNKQQPSWLGSILGGGSGGGSGQASHSKDNLVQAFVQFLEQESQPKVNNMPNLLNITQGSSPNASPNAPSRRTSLASNSGSGGPAPIPIQPLLQNFNLDEFAPSRNSSSILKDILSDS